MTCQYCDSVAKKQFVYEDDAAAIMLHPSPAMPGHVIAIPKQHFTILEQTPDIIIKKLAALANKASTALVQVLGATGTNVIVENGTAAEQQVPHLAINIIPRVEGDGLNFQWHPRKISEEQMSLTELQMREHTKNLGVEDETKEPLKMDDAKTAEPAKKWDYLLKQLKRRP